MAHSWDPDRYLTFADERGRPFVELLARVGADVPHRVVDLGCGAGNLTVLLARRWPQAQILGVDSSSEMIAAAPVAEGVSFSVGDIASWAPAEPVDVLLSNAALQWVPGHLDLLPRAYAAALVFWSYPILIIVAIGTWRTHQRRIEAERRRAAL